jgi:hypothetical protein
MVPDGRKILLCGKRLRSSTSRREGLALPGGPILAEWPLAGTVTVSTAPSRLAARTPLAGLYRAKPDQGRPRRIAGRQEARRAKLTVSAKSSSAPWRFPGGTKLAVGLAQRGGAGSFSSTLWAAADGWPRTSRSPPSDGRAIAAITRAPDGPGSPFLKGIRDGVKIRAVNLATGVWRTLAALGPLDLNAREAQVLAFKPLSWTR